MKQKILYILLSLCAWIVSLGAGANESIISGSSFNSIAQNSIKWNGTHASFTLSGNGMSYYGIYQALQLSWNGSYTLSWTANQSCTINVTEVIMTARTSMEGYITLNGKTSGNISGSKHTITTGNIAESNSENISVVTSNNTGLFNAKPNFFVYDIKVVYTITPDAPICISETKTVDVTVDINNPNNIDLTSCFSSVALKSDSHFESLKYNNSGGTIMGNNFYATKAGTYNISAYLDGQDNCHNQSEKSNDLTITVNRLPGFISASGATMTANETYDLSNCITSAKGSGAVSYEVISENGNTSVINGGSFTPSESGEYIIRATKAQDEQYSEASVEFKITVKEGANIITLSPNVKPNYVPATYGTVILERTLKAGYNSIALPFEASLTDLGADKAYQLSVVTYNAKAGYSLYFKEVTSLAANEPYIIHLQEEKVNPTFSNVTVGAAQPVEKEATGGVDRNDVSYRKWKMVSNYAVGFNMDGKYGVVNADGCLKLGATGSTLAPFSAYIENVSDTSLPSDASTETDKQMVKALFLNGASAIEDVMNGKDTLTGDPEAVYDLQGRKASAESKGVRIVIMNDGTTKKVIK